MKTAGILLILAAAGALLLAGCQLPGDPLGPVFETIAADTIYANEPIAAWGTNYYRFTVGVNGGHLVETYNLDSDIDWILYSSSSLSAASEVDSGALHSDTTAESVVVPLSAGVTYYLVVDEWSGSAGYYDLRIVSP